MEEAFNEEDMREQYDIAVDAIERKIKEFVSQGSSWPVEEVTKLNFHVVPYKPLLAATHIPTESWLFAQKAIKNVKNSNEKCFA